MRLRLACLSKAASEAGLGEVPDGVWGVYASAVSQV